MSWKDFLYFQKQDKLAILLLLLSIVVVGAIYVLVVTAANPVQAEDAASLAQFEAFEASLSDTEEGLKENLRKPYTDNHKTTYPSYTPQPKLKAGETINLNEADTTILKTIPGIGSGYANRIVKYRNLLGGYVSVNQLKEVWGIEEELYAKILPYSRVKGKVSQLAINTLSLDQLKKHPYINYQQAAIIVDIRQRKGAITSLNHLALLDEFSDRDIKRLSPYLSFAPE